jgi:DNA-binding phage protein
MRRIISIIVGFIICAFSLNAQQTVSRTMNAGDSLTVNVKFEKAKLTPDETTAQQQVNTLLTNATNTNSVLATSIDQLTNSVKQGLDLARETKVDRVATQLSITREDVYKSLKRNNVYKLFGLIPFLIVVTWALLAFLMKKGLDISNALKGTSLVAVLALFGAVTIYYTLTLIFNSNFFLIKGLMFSS